MNAPRRGASTLPEICRRYKCSRSFLYEEKDRGRLKISNAGRKALVFDEDEDAWRELCRADEPKASDEKRVLEQVTVAEDVRDVIDIAKSFAKAIAKLPARKRDDLVERFNSLVAERER
jgi:hypothetical protein